MQHPFRTRLVTLTIAAVMAVAVVPAARAPADDKKPDDGWIPLFNGKDLTGWKIPNPPSGQFKAVKETKNADDKVVAFVGETKDGKDIVLWQVKDGTIVGGGPASHIFTEKDDYTDFEYRVEAKINDKGNSGQY